MLRSEFNIFGVLSYDTFSRAGNLELLKTNLPVLAVLG